MARAVYQAAWLDRHCSGGGVFAPGPAPIALLRESLRATRAQFPAFLRAAREAGWDVDTVLIKGGRRWVVRAEEEEEEEGAEGA